MKLTGRGGSTLKAEAAGVLRHKDRCTAKHLYSPKLPTWIYTGRQVTYEAGKPSDARQFLNTTADIIFAPRPEEIDNFLRVVRSANELPDDAGS